MKSIHGMFDGGQVLGIAVGPEDGGHVFVCGAIVGGDGGRAVIGELDEVFLVAGIGGAGRLENEGVGKE